MSIIGNAILLGGGGGGGSVVVWDELDVHGGTIRHIEADTVYGLEQGSATPSTSQQTVNPSSGKYFSSFVVGAIPSEYKDTSDANATASDIRAGKSGYVDGVKVSGNLAERDGDDLTASGDTVTAPAGIYDQAVSKSVAAGTEGTPSATKGQVSNHAVQITPSVTNGAGYISGGTHNGTPVTVEASELVSGSETKTQNGTYDVTNLEEMVVNVPTPAFSTIRTGSGAPSSSLGVDGDIYIQTS